MTKQFSKLSTESAQQLAQLDGASEGKLNELLERIEAEKVNLPVTEHHVIDWGTRVARMRILEREKFREERSIALMSKYADYNEFICQFDWHENLSEELWKPRIQKSLDEIVEDTWSYSRSEAAKDAGYWVSGHIHTFCEQSHIHANPKTVVQGCIDYCNGTAGDSDNSEYAHFYNQVAAGMSSY